MNTQTRMIRPGDKEWPGYLDEIESPPNLLFARGLPIQWGTKAVAVVGTRRPTAAGIEAARMIATGLAQAGLAVISGLAMGIDSVAHRAALEAGGYTLAVLGCGLDLVYPDRNRSLKQRIEGCGTVVSEYPEGVESNAWHFPERNRIIAGLVNAVVVIEGSNRSGALITARRALDCNRAVFAVPGSIRNPMAAGPNELIRTNQAALVTDVKHITDDIAPGLVYVGEGSPAIAPQVALDDVEMTVLYLLDDAPVSRSFVCRETGMAPGQAALALSRLEVRNFVRRTMNGYELTDKGTRVRNQ